MSRGYHRHDPLASEKRCSACKFVKPLDDFGVSSARAHLDGRQNHCRVCMRTASRERHAAKRDQLLEYMSAYHAAHRVEAADRNRQWRVANPEATALRSRQRRGRRADAFVESVDSLIVLECHDGVCGICGEDVDPLVFHVDHIVPLSRGGEHSYANTQPAHPSCNLSKKDRLPEEVAA